MCTLPRSTGGRVRLLSDYQKWGGVDRITVFRGGLLFNKKNYHGGENHEKTIYGGRELPKKGVLGQLADLKGWGLAKKKGK